MLLIFFINKYMKKLYKCEIKIFEISVFTSFNDY